MRFFAANVKTDEGYESVQSGKTTKLFGRKANEVPPFDAMIKKSLRPCEITDFDLGPILGAGSFGKVRFAKHRSTGTVCAVKILSKVQILRQDQLVHIKQEKEILELVTHPFMVNLFGAAQDEEHLYLYMEYVVGGEFFTYLRDAGRLSENVARFYAAEVLLALEYLHDMNVIYRDLKPENMLLDSDGHIKITDFGFAKHVIHRTYTLCGTPDYLAPEIILNKGHGKPVDWWAYGVLVYEMLAGFPPFYDEDPMETYKKIVSGKHEFPSYFSRSARDLIRKLLQPDLSRRFGNLKGGTNDIKQHPWFHQTDWNKMAKKQCKPPIQPKVERDDDLTNFSHFPQDDDDDTYGRASLEIDEQMAFENLGFEGWKLGV